MKIAFLSRYQEIVQRGAEVFVKELGSKLSLRHQVDILSGGQSDCLEGIIKGDYQIVVAINGGLQSLKASLGRLKRNYRLVISGQAGIGKGEIFNLIVAKPDLFVALTEPMLQWALRWAWGSQVIRIPNGVDLNKFRASGERLDFKLKRPVILSVGALVWYKHHERTIEALSLINEGSLLLVGEGPEKDNLENLGKKLLGTRFKIIQADYEDLPKIYRGADLFVLPSWEREAFGIVYLEAMASGLGVVAPNNSARFEIIGEAGVLVDVTNSQKYAEAILKGLHLDWEQKAIKQASKFSWDIICKLYEEAFKNLLSK